MSEQTAQEPTMEEILASIRRIISEDDAPAETKAEPAPAPAPAAVAEPFMHAPADETEDEEQDEVLELTDRWEEPAPAPRAEPAPEPVFAPSAQVHTIGDIEAAPAPRPEPAYEAPRYEAPPPREEPAMDREPLVGDRAADAAASAFSGLAASLMMPREGRSIEDVIKELMRPMLKEWLDANLPTIVEAEVRAEVERIARRGGR